MLASTRWLAVLAAAAGAVVASGVIALAGNGAEQALTARPPGSVLEQQFVRVVQRVGPSVVQIQTAQGLGSGVVLDRQGHIVTNAHVVGSARRPTVTLASGRRVPATVVGSFVPDDLAVIKIEASGLRPIATAPSKGLRVGDIVLAIGNPLGLRSSVTEGIVSALGRTVSEPNGVTIPRAIQTSAAINPGNSGGALVDLSGRLVGIPTLAATDPRLGGQAPGIGFAIPSDVVRDIAGQLVQHGRVIDSRRAYLGVQIGDTLGGAGVYVGGVEAGGPAARAGIRVGDIIVSVAGKPTPTASELGSVLAGLDPGQRVNVVVARGGARRTVPVTLGEYPGS
jgi:S1-C subfamily serine protease